MHPFDDLGVVHSTLQRLMQRDPPVVKLLPRQPGTKEARFAHLLSGDRPEWNAQPGSDAVVTSIRSDGDRIAHLEEAFMDLQREFADLKQQFADFRKQFE
jgi:uncharacterized protein YceH (UPF0502 family)